MKFLTLAAAFIIGCVLACIGYRLERYVLLRNGQKYVYASMAKVTAEALYLIILFFIGKKNNLDLTAILIVGAAGLTLPTFIFTKKLMKLSKEELTDKEQSKENG